jgi:hypothetical protein
LATYSEPKDRLVQTGRKRENEKFQAEREEHVIKQNVRAELESDEVRCEP